MILSWKGRIWRIREVSDFKSNCNIAFRFRRRPLRIFQIESLVSSVFSLKTRFLVVPRWAYLSSSDQYELHGTIQSTGCHDIEYAVLAFALPIPATRPGRRRFTIPSIQRRRFGERPAPCNSYLQQVAVARIPEEA